MGRNTLDVYGIDFHRTLSIDGKRNGLIYKGLYLDVPIMEDMIRFINDQP